MMMRKRFQLVGRLLLAAALLPVLGYAQSVRTTYFMDSAPYRLQLNPALAPDRGYVNLPGIGGTLAGYYSNTMGIGDAIDIIDNAEDADYFTTDKFYGKLTAMNRMSVDAGVDLLSVGWWHGNGFMSLNISAKADGNLGVPLAMFDFLRDMKGINANDYGNYVRTIADGKLALNAYTEVGLGYAHVINERLTLGARLKGLLGVGNVSLKLKRADIVTHLEGIDPNMDWSHADPIELLRATGTASVDVDAELESSMMGLKYEVGDNGYIDDIDLNANKMGVTGMGAAVDLGVDYRVNDAVSLSAAINDLGFISWSGDHTVRAHANTDDLHYDSSNPGDLLRFADVVSTGEVLNLDMMRLHIDQQKSKSRTTKLSSVLALGAQYRLVNNKLGLGLLFTQRFAQLIGNGSELTMAVNYHPRSLVDLAVSYSPIRCGGSSFGLALKLGPLMLGTDYMYLGKGTKCCNALVGLSIPLGKRSQN